jgi:rubrerythrin
MKHWLLRFNYGVEIGARLAYLGHYQATGDIEILKIANEELEHRTNCEWVLRSYGKKPFWGFNLGFLIVGNLIKQLCRVSPEFMMNLVARSMELFAGVNYQLLAKLYPEFEWLFLDMARAEMRHEAYFKQVQINASLNPVTRSGH